MDNVRILTQKLYVNYLQKNRQYKYKINKGSVAHGLNNLIKLYFLYLKLGKFFFSLKKRGFKRIKFSLKNIKNKSRFKSLVLLRQRTRKRKKRFIYLNKLITLRKGKRKRVWKFFNGQRVKRRRFQKKLSKRFFYFFKKVKKAADLNSKKNKNKDKLRVLLVKRPKITKFAKILFIKKRKYNYYLTLTNMEGNVISFCSFGHVKIKTKKRRKSVDAFMDLVKFFSKKLRLKSKKKTRGFIFFL